MPLADGLYFHRMMTAPDERRPALEQRRDEIVARLCDAFAHDALTLEELERRLDAAHGASDRSELESLLSGLPAPVSPASVPAPAPAPAPSPAPREGSPDVVMGVMGAAERRGAWTPAPRVIAIGLMGAAELDLREARMRPGVTEIICVGFMGGVDIVVPPDLPIEIEGGIGLMGGFGHPAEARYPRRKGVPEDYHGTDVLLRVRGVAIMGGVDIDVRLGGETPGDARRRRRRERKELAREREQKRLSRGDA